MSATLAVALYAAGVGTVGLAWQIYAHRQQHRSRLQVGITRARVLGGYGTPELFVHVVNQSLHDLPLGTVVLSWDQEGERRTAPVYEWTSGPQPESLAARQNFSVWLDRPAMHDLGINSTSKAIQATMTTQTGQTFDSPPLTADWQSQTN